MYALHRWGSSPELCLRLRRVPYFVFALRTTFLQNFENPLLVALTFRRLITKQFLVFSIYTLELIGPNKLLTINHDSLVQNIRDILLCLFISSNVAKCTRMYGFDSKWTRLTVLGMLGFLQYISQNLFIQLYLLEFYLFGPNA